MKVELSTPHELVTAISDDVVAKLRPLLAARKVEEDSIEGLMGVNELGNYLGGVSRDWIYQRTAGNEIPFVRVGHLVKFRRSDIDRWLAKQSVPAVAPLSAPLPGRRARDNESHAAGKTG